MKPWILWIVALFFFASPAWAASGSQTFSGAYFTVKIPGGFKAKPSLNNGGSSPDSAFFTSPDGKVEFYIYSPIWNGNPTDIQVKSATEEITDQKEEKNGAVIVRRVTIKAKDGSYFRSYEDTEDTEHNTRRVLGIRYANAEAYAQYKDAYLAFKKSLQQFSD